VIFEARGPTSVSRWMSAASSTMNACWCSPVSEGGESESGVELGEVGARGAHIFHVRDGKVVKRVFYMHRDRALADLGLAREVDSP
jgi:hypothetical protein